MDPKSLSPSPDLPPKRKELVCLGDKLEVAFRTYEQGVLGVYLYVRESNTNAELHIHVDAAALHHVENYINAVAGLLHSHQMPTPASNPDVPPEQLPS